jgi:hypothetical protein
MLGGGCYDGITEFIAGKGGMDFAHLVQHDPFMSGDDLQFVIIVQAMLLYRLTLPIGKNRPGCAGSGLDKVSENGFKRQR